MNHARCQKCWYHAQHIETTCFCCISELTHSVPRTVLSRGKGMQMSETLPTCSVRRSLFPARKTHLKSSTLIRSSQIKGQEERVVPSKSNQTLFREEVICVEEQHQGLPARSPVDFVRRLKEVFLMEFWFSSTGIKQVILDRSVSWRARMHANRTRTIILRTGQTEKECCQCSCWLDTHSASSASQVYMTICLIYGIIRTSVDSWKACNSMIANVIIFKHFQEFVSDWIWIGVCFLLAWTRAKLNMVKLLPKLRMWTLRYRAILVSIPSIRFSFTYAPMSSASCSTGTCCSTFPPISVMIRQDRFQPGVVLHLVTSSFGLLYLKRVALRCLTLIHSWKLECLQALLLFLDDVLLGSTRLARKASQFTLLLLGIQLWWIVGLLWCWLQGIEPIEAFTTRCWRGCESRGFVYRFLQRGSESVTLFHLFHLLIDWSGTCGFFWCWCGCWGCLFSGCSLFACFSMLLANHFDRVV